MNRVRRSNDIQRVIYSYVCFTEKRGHLQQFQVKIHYMFISKKRGIMKGFEKINPTFFCMNDKLIC